MEPVYTERRRERVRQYTQRADGREKEYWLFHTSLSCQLGDRCFLNCSSLANQTRTERGSQSLGLERFHSPLEEPCSHSMCCSPGVYSWNPGALKVALRGPKAHPVHSGSAISRPLSGDNQRRANGREGLAPLSSQSPHNPGQILFICVCRV